MRRRTLLHAGLLLAVGVALSAPAALRADPADASWLARVNFYRATASLPAVVEDPALSRDVARHARYMVMHEVIKHSENPRQKGASPEGAAAAASSNLAGSTRPDEQPDWAIDVWMQAPFHALGILDPALRRVGFGIEHAPTGSIQTAAGLDVLRGRGAAAPPSVYPILWPADGATVPIGTHTAEYPNPLTSCRGYSAPAGLPLIVQLGSGKATPHVEGSWISDGARWLEHCVFDETTYRNGDSEQQRLGRSILAARDAVVLIPREPLAPGGYHAIVDVSGRRVEWSFSID